MLLLNGLFHLLMCAPSLICGEIRNLEQLSLPPEPKKRFKPFPSKKQIFPSWLMVNAIIAVGIYLLWFSMFLAGVNVEVVLAEVRGLIPI